MLSKCLVWMLLMTFLVTGCAWYPEYKGEHLNIHSRCDYQWQEGRYTNDIVDASIRLKNITNDTLYVRLIFEGQSEFSRRTHWLEPGQEMLLARTKPLDELQVFSSTDTSTANVEWIELKIKPRKLPPPVSTAKEE